VLLLETVPNDDKFRVYFSRHIDRFFELLQFACGCKVPLKFGIFKQGPECVVLVSIGHAADHRQLLHCEENRAKLSLHCMKPARSPQETRPQDLRGWERRPAATCTFKHHVTLPPSFKRQTLRVHGCGKSSAYRQMLHLRARHAGSRSRGRERAGTKLMPIRMPSNLSCCTTLESSSPISDGMGLRRKHVVAPL
jgi:hypothetical protein